MDLRSQLQDHLGTAYQLERELGGGGMSRVFVAHEHRLSRKVVIKVLSPELVQGLNAERFEREILLAASLQQANIVPVLAAGEVGGLPYFTMPFIEGESLRNRLTGSGLPINDILAILRDVARALAYAHARGIVHRDIKPDNVLLSGDTAVVTDFGIAKALSASRTAGVGATLTSVGTSIGTPAYMAPEQVAGDPDIDHRVDLYALGCVAFELLTGRSPFSDRTAQKMLAAHLGEVPVAVELLRPDCPPALGLLVTRLLEKDPADRIASARDVLTALDEVATITSPSDAMSARGRFARAMLIYAASFAAVVILAKAAVVGIGLPEWTITGAIGVMLLGLPVLLVTAWAKWLTRRASTATPTLTPGGSQAVQPAGTMATIALKANRHLSWRRTARGGIYAMTGFVLLIAGFMVTRAMGVGPAASLFAAGTLAADDKVLLADFVATPEDSALTPIVVEAVRAAMSQSRAVRMLEPADVAQALAQMQRDSRTPLTSEVATEVAARTGARAILGGRLVRAGAGYLVSLELVSAEGGAPLASFQGTADGVSDLLGVVDQLSRKLRGKVGESLRQVQRSVPLERATTASLEALRLFSEGSRANDVEQDFDRAVRVLREAVAIDSTFALAWRKLNAAMSNARLPAAARDSALERAMRYADKLPPGERHLIQGAYYQGHSIHTDRAKALAEYRTLYSLDSTDRVASNQLAMLYWERADEDSALRYVLRQQQIEPGVANAMKIIRGLAETGRGREARLLLDSLRAADPAAASFGQLNVVETFVAYNNGEWDQARSTAVLASRDPQLPIRLNGLGQAARLDWTNGRLRSAAALEHDRIALMASRGAIVIGGVEESFADIHYRGDPVAAVARLDRIVASSQWAQAEPFDRAYWDMAMAYADAGAPDKARRMLAMWQNDAPEAYAALGFGTLRSAAEGMVMMAENNHDAALQSLRAAMTEPDGAPTRYHTWFMALLARAHDKAGHADSTQYWLERYLELPAARRFFADTRHLAMVRKRLGELYEQRSDTAAAIAQYAALVDQWGDADAELQPAVASIRARIRELGGMEGN